MEVSRANPEMRDLESLISGIQQVSLSLPQCCVPNVRFLYHSPSPQSESPSARACAAFALILLDQAGCHCRETPQSMVMVCAPKRRHRPRVVEAQCTESLARPQSERP